MTPPGGAHSQHFDKKQAVSADKTCASSY